MLSSVRIAGFRGLRQFEMSGLARINLLVGSNNCGKTSVLEAIYLLMRRADRASILELFERRGESAPIDTTQVPGVRTGLSTVYIHDLFTGHLLRAGSEIQIAATNGSSGRDLSIRADPSEKADEYPDLLVLNLSGNPKPATGVLRLSSGQVLVVDTIGSSSRRGLDDPGSRVMFLSTAGIDSEMLIGMWDRIALTRHQEFVVSALRILDPSVEDVAPQLARSGFIVRRSGQAPFPIGSLGEGTTRMLALAIAMTQCRGGLLLVDEIDTGLHYSVLSRMWKLIYHAAMEMDVQVFATTHSHDCIQSLSLISSELADRHGITIQRVEQGKPRAVAYSHDEVAILASHDIEVR